MQALSDRLGWEEGLCGYVWNFLAPIIGVCWIVMHGKRPYMGTYGVLKGFGRGRFGFRATHRAGGLSGPAFDIE